LVRTRQKDADSLEDLVGALEVFDSDHDGKITVEEFKYAMMTMGEKM
jgi:Ca2+-binding EF-hand superfamily protein